MVSINAAILERRFMLWAGMGLAVVRMSGGITGMHAALNDIVHPALTMTIMGVPARFEQDGFPVVTASSRTASP